MWRQWRQLRYAEPLPIGSPDHTSAVMIVCRRHYGGKQLLWWLFAVGITVASSSVLLRYVVPRVASESHVNLKAPAVFDRQRLRGPCGARWSATSLVALKSFKKAKPVGFLMVWFPTCQVRVVRFYQSCSPPPPPHPPPPPRSPDPSGHSRTSTASSRSQSVGTASKSQSVGTASRSQWALPDLNRDFQIAVGTAGPQPRLPDRSGHCRTSTATSRSQWALPDLNRDFQIAVGTAGPQPRLPDRSGHYRTSTGRMWEKMSDRMSEDMPDRMPERMSERMSEDMTDRMSEDMPERMSEDMSDRMSEDMPDRMPEKMSDSCQQRWKNDVALWCPSARLRI